MTDIVASSGSKVYMCASAPATVNQAGYEALTWIEISKVATIADIERVASEVEFMPLNGDSKEVLAGSKSNGQLPISGAFVHDDAGQVALTTAYGTGAKIFLKVALSDTGASTPTTIYCDGRVLSDSVTGLGGPDEVLGFNYNVSLGNDYVRVDAA